MLVWKFLWKHKSMKCECEIDRTFVGRESLDTPDLSCVLSRMAQPGVTGVLCADQQGLALTGVCTVYRTPSPA